MLLTQAIKNVIDKEGGTGIWTAKEMSSHVQEFWPHANPTSVTAILCRDMLKQKLVIKTNLKVKRSRDGVLSRLFTGINADKNELLARAREQYMFVKEELDNDSFILHQQEPKPKTKPKKPAKQSIKRAVKQPIEKTKTFAQLNETDNLSHTQLGRAVDLYIQSLKEDAVNKDNQIQTLLSSGRTALDGKAEVLKRKDKRIADLVKQLNKRDRQIKILENKVDTMKNTIINIPESTEGKTGTFKFGDVVKFKK